MSEDFDSHKSSLPLDAPTAEMIGTFRARCLDVVSRGIGKLLVSDDTYLEVINDLESSIVCCSIGQKIEDVRGAEKILWTDIALNQKNILFKNIEEENITEGADMPVPASKEQVDSFMHTNILSLAGFEGATTMLIEHVRAAGEAQDMGLKDVSAVELQAAIDLMTSVSEV